MTPIATPAAEPTGQGGSRLGLSWSQRLLWTGQRLHPDSPLYNMVLAFEINGDLDPERFEAAFRSAVRRADALRLQFDEVAQAFSVVEPGPVAVDIVDVSGSPNPAQAARDWMADAAKERFVLSGPLYRCALVHLGPSRWVWFLNQHHLVTDAWSCGLLFDHVSEAYVDLGRVASESLPTYQEYHDFLANLEESPMLERAREHWRNAEASGRRPASLYGKQGHTRQTTASERVSLVLGSERTARINALAESAEARALTSDASRFNVFAALVAAFVHRVSGASDLALGVFTHNRPTARLKEVVGDFVELFPLEVAVEEDATLVDLLAVAKNASGLLLRYALPGASNPKANRPANVVLNYMTAGFGDFAGHPTSARLVHSGHSDITHDVRVQVHEFPEDGFGVELDLAVELFDAAERELLSRHFVAFIDAALDRPDAPVAALEMASDDEIAQVHSQFSGADVPTPGATGTVLEAIRARVAAAPESVALVTGDTTWSYADLYGRALGVAEALETVGVRGESVALAMPRSADAVAAILGILESGAAYVPIDPKAPPERVALIIERAGAVAVVGDAEGVPSNLPAVDPAAVEPLSGPRLSDDRFTPAPDDVAYTLFTSGSTGEPKGVVVEHGALSHYAHWAAQEYLSDEQSRFALFTPLTFDLTVTSIFAPLVRGAGVVVYEDRSEAVDTAVIDVFRDDTVDVVKLTPSHLALVVGDSTRTRRIGTLVLGGEELRRDLARSALSAIRTDGRVINEYGPTETTVACTLHHFDPTSDLAPTVPIGRPIPGATIALVDPRGALVPTGVAGEIVVGGIGVARGYLGDSDLTDERFVQDPIRPTQRAYRTGDAGRWRPDGVLEFLGRLDRQLKIHGVRVEPAEIEAALTDYPGVDQVVVLGVDDPVDVRSDEDPVLCVRCGIPSNHPGIEFGADDVCSSCSAFEGYQDSANEYFGTMDELEKVLTSRAHATAPYDCLMLLSGGKDSSYALCRLSDMGLRILAVTLDNGFISDGAKANAKRVTDHLGVDHEFITSEHMNSIFVDSLERYSNVCQGCFKTMYTLAFNMALERGIPSIVTGLSRGQFFETRLTEELFLGPKTTRAGLELVVLDARKSYHRADDYVNSVLDTRAFHDDDAFDRVEFVDFYRYCDVGLDEMLGYLDEKAPWIRPADTGRSTNCLINDVGIHVHKLEKGFHNYALPYSWDVILGHKNREAALEELDDDIDLERVDEILTTLGYVPKVSREGSGSRLVAYLTGTAQPSAPELRGFLKTRLPQFMIPNEFVGVEDIPLTSRGKVDVAALGDIRAQQTPAARDGSGEPPRTATERLLVELWSAALRVDRLGVDVNFFDAGGDSITAIRLSARARAEGLSITPNELFRHQTIRELAAVIDGRGPEPEDAAAGSSEPSDEPSQETLSQIAKLLGQADKKSRRDAAEE